MKKEPLYKKYGTVRPIGVKGLAIDFGLLVFEPIDENCDVDFITAWRYPNGRYNFSRNRVHYTSSGRAYLWKGNIRFYLDEISRV